MDVSCGTPWIGVVMTRRTGVFCTSSMRFITRLRISVSVKMPTGASFSVMTTRPTRRSTMSRVTSRMVLDGSAVITAVVMISLTLFVNMGNLHDIGDAACNSRLAGWPKALPPATNHIKEKQINFQRYRSRAGLKPAPTA